MAITRLKRKAKKNKLKALFRKTKLKHLLERPILKKITRKKQRDNLPTQLSYLLITKQSTGWSMTIPIAYF